jgi:hypothetical protein
MGARPNLFIIGAMKCGTTSLHRYLGAHPDIFMCEPKEPGYFVEELNWSREADWYLAHFAQAGGAKFVGESSTHYTKLPTYRGVPERIQSFSPAARFIYVMRDPVARTVSHYWHNVRDLREEAERRDMLTAVQRDPRYIDYSDYAMQLRPYFERFGTERVKLLTFEELVADPAATVARLCQWLDLPERVPPSVFASRWNARPAEMRGASGWGGLNRIRNTSLYAAVRPLVPRPLRSFATRLAEKPIRPEEARTKEAIAHVRPILTERVQDLARLVKRAFPEWEHVHGSGSDERLADALAD